jgi:hypothetical protein
MEPISSLAEPTNTTAEPINSLAEPTSTLAELIYLSAVPSHFTNIDRRPLKLFFTA